MFVVLRKRKRQILWQCAREKLADLILVVVVKAAWLAEKKKV